MHALGLLGYADDKSESRPISAGLVHGYCFLYHLGLTNIPILSKTLKSLFAVSFDNIVPWQRDDSFCVEFDFERLR